MTLKKKIGWTAGILLVLIVGICIGGSLYLIDFSLRPENRGKNMEESEAFMRTEYPQIVPWLDSLQQHHALRDTFITAPDGIRMHAFYARASRPTRRTAIMYTDIRTMPSACSTSATSITSRWITTFCCRTCVTRD